MVPTRSIPRLTSGFTITEMLATMLIMVLASTLLATGVPVAIDTYQKTVNSANAQVAMSTTITVLRSEYGLSPKVMSRGMGDDTEVYYMTEEGLWAIIRNPKGDEAHKGLVKEYVKTDDYGNPDPSSSLGTYPLVPDAAFKGANRPLELRVVSITKETGKVSITNLSVTDGTNELAKVDSYDIATRFAK